MSQRSANAIPDKLDPRDHPANQARPRLLPVPRRERATQRATVVLASGAMSDINAVAGTLHATEHAAIGLLPLFTICDRWDVGGVSIAHHQDTDAPTVFVYDGYPGGAGIAELGFSAADRHLAATLEVITACACVAGCPSCVQSPKCGNGNEPLDKLGSAALLRTVLNPPLAS